MYIPKSGTQLTFLLISVHSLCIISPISMATYVAYLWKSHDFQAAGVARRSCAPPASWWPLP